MCRGLFYEGSDIIIITINRTHTHTHTYSILYGRKAATDADIEEGGKGKRKEI